MRILIYLPPNSRAVDQQSVMELFIKMGHEVYLLTQMPEGDLHKNVARFGVKTFSAGMNHNTGINSYFRNIRYLRQFIREHKIEVVFAHLQGAGIVSGIVRKFSRFRLFYIRHNTDEHRLQKSKNAAVLNWLANKLAPCIIAPSEKVYRYITEVERVDRSRIVRINYGYNFSQYMESDRTGVAASIRQQFACKMLVISVARLIPVKRHLLMFQVLNRLVQGGMDIKMICLGNGPALEELQEFIKQEELQKNIFLLGAKKNVFDYLEAADVFFHLSLSEASNSAVKEAGYCKKTAIVCSDVGDFDEYVKNNINGFILNKESPGEAAEKAFIQLYNSPEKIKSLGESIYQTIIAEFDIENVRNRYQQILTVKT